ncbi:hypothetical protein [Caballeronia sp. LZ034LL]|uniref:hypothetical protein n=1 Tax=Caballeronia sp. LZ034LL TaxID=3038567 RepID=UPI00285A2376|nr:hypothetical protein [Caballeronia sp. LZ034LL]MDR5839351.1 hypothetical protein [Caballeronia sp. LZ034LL]
MNRLELWLLRLLVRKAIALARHRLITVLMVEAHREHWPEDNLPNIQAIMANAVKSAVDKARFEVTATVENDMQVTKE